MYFIENLEYIEREQIIYYVTIKEINKRNWKDINYIIYDILEYRNNLY